MTQPQIIRAMDRLYGQLVKEPQPSGWDRPTLERERPGWIRAFDRLESRLRNRSRA